MHVKHNTLTFQLLKRQHLVQSHVSIEKTDNVFNYKKHNKKVTDFAITSLIKDLAIIEDMISR